MFIFDNKKVSTKHSNYIGVDLSNNLIVITNGNPYMKGLMDVHKCAYLPSGHNNSDIDSESSTIARVRRNLVEISNWNHALIIVCYQQTFVVFEIFTFFRMLFTWSFLILQFTLLE